MGQTLLENFVGIKRNTSGVTVGIKFGNVIIDPERSLPLDSGRYYIII